MSTHPSLPPSTPANRGGADTGQDSTPVWDLLDREDVQVFLAYEKRQAFEAGYAAGWTEYEKAHAATLVPAIRAEVRDNHRLWLANNATRSEWAALVSAADQDVELLRMIWQLAARMHAPDEVRALISDAAAPLTQASPPRAA